PPQTCSPSSRSTGPRPRLSAPSTLVVMPDECQSMPITQPSDWNQNGCASRRSTSSRPYSSTSASTSTRPSAAMRDASQAGTRPPCSGRSALPVRPIRMFSIARMRRARFYFALEGGPMARSLSLAALFALVALAGCAPFRWYQLPVAPDDAHATFTPIAMAASQLGYRYYIQDDRVVV